MWNLGNLSVIIHDFYRFYLTLSGFVIPNKITALLMRGTNANILILKIFTGQIIYLNYSQMLTVRVG